MIKKYYYILFAIIATLLFGVSANATTTEVTQSISVNNGTPLNVYTQSYTNILGHDISSEGNAEGDSYIEFSPNYNIVLTGTNQQYLNGYAILTFNVSATIPNASNWTYEGLEYIRPYNVDGVQVFMGLNNYNFYRILIIFDNFYNTGNQIDLGTVTMKYTAKIGDVTPLLGNFQTSSISVYSNHLVKTLDFQNNRTTNEIYNAIYQATGSQLLDIVTMLTNIRNQDALYYQQLVTSLASINQSINTTNADLLLILSELDTDFSAVQTVLDLFPSYRTQVLQYWQELLQMNAQQSSQAAEIESQYANQGNQSDILLGGLDSISFPTISSNQMDIMGNLDADAKSNFFGLIATITNNGFVTTVLIIIVTGMIVGYVLYGKK